VAWQIMDLSENPTTIILDNPRNVAPNLIASDKTLESNRKRILFQITGKMKNHWFLLQQIFLANLHQKFQRNQSEIIKGVDYV
jgi:L-threonylcarbamoyladenylate synthase